MGEERGGEGEGGGGTLPLFRVWEMLLDLGMQQKVNLTRPQIEKPHTVHFS